MPAESLSAARRAWVKCAGFFGVGRRPSGPIAPEPRLSPTARILASFAGLIVVGAVLLSMPVCVAQGQRPLGWVDALFVSTAAVCVTGLTTIDVGACLSGFGQAVLLLLIQAGGLGFLTLSTGLLMSLGLRSTVLDRAALLESLGGFSAAGLRKLLRVVLLVTLSIELTGAVVLTWRFSSLPGFSFPQACWFGLFHAVSAFCNAGFSLFSRAAGHGADNLAGFTYSPLISFAVPALIVMGGLGFVVLEELIAWVRSRGRKRLGLHTKIVLASSGALILLGTLLFLLLEWANPRSLGNVPWYRALLPSLFHSVSARTAGFNTLDLAQLTSPTLLLLMGLMFVGGSPGSCAGGVKTTTAFVLVSMAVARARMRRNPNAFGREIGYESVSRAAKLALAAAVFVVLMAGIVLAAEGDRITASCRGGVFLDLLFETVSAFGTVGLSTGVTPTLAPISKLALVLTMYAGRVGPLMLFATLARPPAEDRVRLPDEAVLVG